MSSFLHISGYGGKYSVNESGVVMNNITKRVMKQSITIHGYYVISLYLGDKRYFHASVHRLVAECFCERKEGMDIVNHIDGNKLNNHYTNLEWTTASGNMRHSVHVLGNVTWLTINKPSKGKFGILARDHKKIVQKDKMGNFIKQWDGVNHAARELGLQPSCISNCCNGKRKTTGGYTWSFAA